jgi:hypothetical protein
MINNMGLSDSGDFSPNRRQLLRSATAAMAALGATSGAAGARPTSSATAPSRTDARRADGDLKGKKIIGYMLAHEQFAVPKLVELGGLAAHAGFGLLATSDHFQPWQANEGIAAKPGSPWLHWGSRHGQPGSAPR